MEENLYLTPEQVRLLLLACDGDAALLYLWMKSGRTVPCPLSGDRLEQAKHTLHRIGMEHRREKALERDERPVYSEDVVTKKLRENREFSLLVGEVQRTLGRLLSTEELKSLLSVQEYLRLPEEVIGILVSYCVQKNRARGMRAPSMRTIEKEAYHWADEGIDTVDTAARYMQTELAKQGRMGRIASLLQISGRRLTRAEEQYVGQWVSWGFGDDVIRMAYEKTCLATGGLKWPYLHSILSSWQEKNLKTVEEIRQGDSHTKKPTAKKREVSDFEREAVRKLMAAEEV